MTKVGVLFGGISPEHDISILTGLQAARGLSNTPHQVCGVYWSKTGEFYETDINLEAKDFAAGVPSGSKLLSFSIESGFSAVSSGRFSKSRDIEIDVILIALHGGPGEDGSIQSVLDLAGIPYTGPDSMGAATGMDKLAFGGVLSSKGVPSLPRELLSEGGDAPRFDGPFILKPRYGGSSIGIDVVEDIDTARARLRSNVHLRRGAVIEPFRPDLFDLQIAIRTYPRLELSSIEKPVKSGVSSEILSYKDKYVAGEGMVAAPRELPADIPGDQAKKVKQFASIVAELLPVRGIARIDFLSNGKDELYVNEINTIPGSLSKYLFVDPPIAFESLLNDLIDEAMKVKTFFPLTTGADGSALVSAGSIAAKLS